MRQALHIFRKDARRFAYQIYALIILTLVWAWINIAQKRGDIPVNHYAGFAAAVLIMGWWYLVSLLIHEEPLTGDRQFWITRPYSRRSLATAKLLFVLAFFNLPLLLAGFASLAAAGYQPLVYLPNFLWMQLTFTAVVLFVPVAVAALTRTLAQFVLAMLGLCLGLTVLNAVFAALTQGFHVFTVLVWAGGIFLPLLCATAALMVFILQLRTRNRLVSAGAGICLAVVMLCTGTALSRQFAIAVQSRMFGHNAAASQAAVISAGGIQPDPKHPAPDGVTLAVPLRVVNIPAGETAGPELVELTFETPAGRRWSSGWISAASTEGDVFQVDPSADGAFTWKQLVVVDRSFWQQARSGPLALRGDVYVMLFGRSEVRLEDDGATRVPGDGRCSMSFRTAYRSVNCLAPFHMPFNKPENQPDTALSRAALLPTRLLSVWDSPLPADFGMNPLWANTASGNQAGVLFLRYHPAAYIRRSFSDFNVHPPR